MKKLLSIVLACMTFAMGQLTYAANPHEDEVNLQATDAQSEAFAAATAAAVATGYRFVSICTVLSKSVCPYGSNPIWFGTGANWTLTQCHNAWIVINRNALFSAYPRTLSTCAIF